MASISYCEQARHRLAMSIAIAIIMTLFVATCSNIRSGFVLGATVQTTRASTHAHALDNVSPEDSVGRTMITTLNPASNPFKVVKAIATPTKAGMNDAVNTFSKTLQATIDASHGPIPGWMQQRASLGSQVQSKGADANPNEVILPLAHRPPVEVMDDQSKTIAAFESQQPWPPTHMQIVQA
jgi:hypothetical protein